MMEPLDSLQGFIEALDDATGNLMSQPRLYWRAQGKHEELDYRQIQERTSMAFLDDLLPELREALEVYNAVRALHHLHAQYGISATLTTSREDDS